MRNSSILKKCQYGTYIINLTEVSETVKYSHTIPELYFFSENDDPIDVALKGRKSKH